MLQCKRQVYNKAVKLEIKCLSYGKREGKNYIYPIPTCVT